jgi:DNA-binding XRE family transcriptional regulator
MEEYLVDINSKDIGEIVEMIRISHIKMHSEPFANKIGVSEKTLLSVEDGLSAHGMLVLKKINEAFPNVNIKFNVELK